MDGNAFFDGYWDAQARPSWCKEAPITRQRAVQLVQIAQSNRAQGDYVLAGEALTRADIEWMTYEMWRRGGHTLDLQQTQLAEVDLSDLPFNCIEVRNDRVDYCLGITVLLNGATLFGANLSRTKLYQAQMQQARLAGANLQEAELLGVDFRDADLVGTNLDNANLAQSWLAGAKMVGTRLVNTNMRFAAFSPNTMFRPETIGDHEHGCVVIEGARWNNVDVTSVDWSPVYARKGMLGDERLARRKTNDEGHPKTQQEWIGGYQTAIGANRQLSLLLQNQGINDAASELAYRASLLQRTLFKLQHRRISYLSSWSFWAVSGYGYRIGRSLLTYFTVLAVFTILYFFVVREHIPARHQVEHLTLLEAAILSVTNFHGRIFLPENIGNILMDDVYGVVAATEAFLALIVEAILIATFTRRFFR